jgi:hypothetical protein
MPGRGAPTLPFRTTAGPPPPQPRPGAIRFAGNHPDVPESRREIVAKTSDLLGGAFMFLLSGSRACDDSVMFGSTCSPARPRRSLRRLLASGAVAPVPSVASQPVVRSALPRAPHAHPAEPPPHGAECHRNVLPSARAPAHRTLNAPAGDRRPTDRSRNAFPSGSGLATRRCSLMFPLLWAPRQHGSQSPRRDRSVAPERWANANRGCHAVVGACLVRAGRLCTCKPLAPTPADFGVIWRLTPPLRILS